MTNCRQEPLEWNDAVTVRINVRVRVRVRVEVRVILESELELGLRLELILEFELELVEVTKSAKVQAWFICRVFLFFKYITKRFLT